MSSVLAILTLGILTPQAAAPMDSDWPQFQGPDRTGRIESSGMDFDWPEGGPEVLWRVDIGPGYGGASVQGGEVFLLDRLVGQRDILRVFDLKTGEEKWEFAYAARGRLNFPGSRTVPSVAGDLVYTVGGFGQVYCLNRKTEESVWETDLGDVYQGERPIFGWSASPLVIGDKVIITPLGEAVGMVALDRHTGEELWVTEPLGYSHSTPTILTLHGREQIVFLSTRSQGSGQDTSAPMLISSFEPEFGDMLWQTETPLTRLPIPGAVQIDDERFFVTGGYRGGSTMLHVKKDGNKYELEELFHIDRGAQIHQPLLKDDHLYLLVNENWNDSRSRRKEGGLLCLSLDGEEVWRTADNPFFGRGNAVLVGDSLLIQDGHNGLLRVVQASPDGYELLIEADLFRTEDEADHQMWAPMAIADGCLLIRSQEELLCVRL